MSVGQGDDRITESRCVEVPLLVHRLGYELAEAQPVGEDRIFGLAAGARAQISHQGVGGHDLCQRDVTVIGGPHIELRTSGKLVEEVREVPRIGGEELLDNTLLVG